MDGDQRLRSVDDECAHPAGQCIHRTGDGTVDEGGSRERPGRRLIHRVQPTASRQPRAEDAQVAQGRGQREHGEVAIFMTQRLVPAALGLPGGVAQRARQPRMMIPWLAWRTLTGYSCGGKATSCLAHTCAASGLLAVSRATNWVKPGEARLRVYW
jgi:hypothetical protein